jgi:AcrR family transcriptional regulator
MAAVELVVREAGLEGATVRAIAAKAGLSVGSVYRRFANKRALLLAVQERFLARRTERASWTLRFARRRYRRGARSRKVLTTWVKGAILAVERDRPLLHAFASAAVSDAEIHAVLVASIEHLAGRPVAAALPVDVLLTALRGLVPDASLPSRPGIPRDALASHLSDIVWMSAVARPRAGDAAPARGRYSSPP